MTKTRKTILAISVIMMVFTVGLLFTGCGESQQKSVAKKTECSADKSEDKEVKKTDYPNLEDFKDLSVLVSIKKQKLYIKSGKEAIFETAVSTGKEGYETPTGDFVIEPEKGEFFYSPGVEEGGYYWVSFKDHGLYMFHSVPTDEEGNIIDWEAKLLGKPVSHGCIRMSMEASKWFYENIPQGVPVHVR